MSGDEALGSLLSKCGLLSAVNLQRVQRAREVSGDGLLTVLLTLGLVSERDLADTLHRETTLSLTSSSDFPDRPPTAKDLTPRFLKHHRVLPLREEDGVVALAMANPLDDYAADAVGFALERSIHRLIALPSELNAAWARFYGDTSLAEAMADDAKSSALLAGVSDTDGDTDRLKDLASDAPVIHHVDALITRAVLSRASDIHIEPGEQRLRVRYRIDGVLQDVEAPPHQLHAAIVSRIKVMARLNIAERRLPQDGRLQLAVQGREIDVRVATAPTMHGEDVVLRILDRSGLVLDLTGLGFDPDIRHQFDELLSRPHGIILVTGPVGSGKTTTLYACLQSLNRPGRKIVTIEDPIEYQLEGVRQVQVKPQIDLSFANALRFFVRQDLDVMMIGEIRDSETVQMAVQAALIGRLVLSTLHTNNATSALTRLLNMGIESYLLTSTVNAVAAQRLVRTLCPHCREPFRPDAQVVDQIGLSRCGAGDLTFFRAVGCDACQGMGYRGRTSILELLTMSDPIRSLVHERAEATQLQRKAIELGMRTMQQHGAEKVLAGTTTVEEVLRVTRDV